MDQSLVLSSFMGFSRPPLGFTVCFSRFFLIKKKFRQRLRLGSCTADPTSAWTASVPTPSRRYRRRPVPVRRSRPSPVSWTTLIQRDSPWLSFGMVFRKEWCGRHLFFFWFGWAQRFRRAHRRTPPAAGGATARPPLPPRRRRAHPPREQHPVVSVSLATR